jgi:hypothetical protein
MTEADKPNGAFDLFKLWKEYEGVAMHFNDLIIRLRSQSLGGVAAVATLAAVVARNDTTTELRWGLLAGAFFLLCMFWVAVWFLDMGYYNRLLSGAVDALLTIESESKNSMLVDRIELSTKIDERVKSGVVGNNGHRNTFYVIVFIALLLGLAVSVCNLRADIGKQAYFSRNVPRSGMGTISSRSADSTSPSTDKAGWASLE